MSLLIRVIFYECHFLYVSFFYVSFLIRCHFLYESFFISLIFCNTVFYNIVIHTRNIKILTFNIFHLPYLSIWLITFVQNLSKDIFQVYLVTCLHTKKALPSVWLLLYKQAISRHSILKHWEYSLIFCTFKPKSTERQRAHRVPFRVEWVYD